MAEFKCKICGGTLEITGSETVAVCEYCGTKQTLPKLNNERKSDLFDRANHFRRNNEFDKAMSIYEAILNEDKTDAECYWSILLCRYGIEYVEDPVSKKRIPTINRAQYTSVFMDEDYKSAIHYADVYQKTIYEEEAKAIDEIQKGILQISQKEEPFDVFICYKETDSNGRRTIDSVLATELYHELCKEGFKVFFSRITLEDKLGTAYEPYIFAALNSAKVMVVLGTKQEHFNAVWVRNEWSRYLALIKSGAKKVLIPAYKDMLPYDLPDEFSHLQAQDMSKLGFMQDLVRGIRKIAGEEKSTVVRETVISATPASANADALIERAFIFLEDGEFDRADEFCEQALNIEPKNAHAYLGKLMAETKTRKREMLVQCSLPFDNSSNYQKIQRFGDDELKTELEGYINTIVDRNETNRLEGIYIPACNIMRMATDERGFSAAAERFKSISGYKNSDELAKECIEKAEIARKDSIISYAKASIAGYDINDCEKAVEMLKTISGWKDADSLVVTLNQKIENLRVELAERTERERERERLAKIEIEKRKEKTMRIAALTISAVVVFIILIFAVIIPSFQKYEAYKAAVELEEKGKTVEAAMTFGEMSSYKDSRERSFALWDDIAQRKTIATGDHYTVGINADGTVVATGDNVSRQCNVSDWTDIIAVDTGHSFTAGLKANGTVITTEDYYDTSDWKDIVDIAAGNFHIVGLKADGTVVAYDGVDGGGECDVSEWTDIVDISAGAHHTIGLKADGTVVAAGDNDSGQCNVSDWTDIVAISAGELHTVGLKADGTVVAVGWSVADPEKVNNWTDIVAISTGYSHTVGIKADGTVIAVDGITWENYGECDVSDWTDIVAVSAGENHTIGLKADGTVVATEYIDVSEYNYDDYKGQCDVSGWKNIKLPNKTK